jgi:hypothetical protein
MDAHIGSTRAAHLHLSRSSPILLGRTAEGKIAMKGLDWRPLWGVERSQLSEARLQAHYAVQWLARTARAFVPPQPDDSHTNLGWIDALDGFTTHPLKDDLRLSLRIVDLTLGLLGDGTARGRSYPLNERSDVDARNWLGEQLRAKGLDARALDAPPPYKIPTHAIATGTAYDATRAAHALAGLAAWFANAHHLLESIKGQMIGRKLAASPVRCWPHHFDIATLISLDESNAKKARTVNVGLSPGDEHYNEPYFYVSPYPYPDAAALPPLSKLGHWHTHGFTAAIAPSSRIIQADDQKAETEAFLLDAIEGVIKTLN